jgi:Xaa-Pro dipeptidase
MAPTLAFEMDEYRRRLQRLREKMAERGIDTLLATNPVSTCYLTGYETFGLLAYQCLIVPSDGEPALIVFELELPGVFLSSWITDGVAYRSGQDPYQATRAQLERRGLLRGTIGVERDSPYTTVENHERLVAALDGARLADASGLVKYLMARKSPVEVEAIRAAARITALGMQAAVDALAPGVTDNDVAAAAYDAMIKGGSEPMCLDPVVTTGTRSGVPHTTHQRVTINPGDPVWIELGACYHRYSGPLMRTAVVGDPPPGWQQLADASLEALKTVMATLRPGITAEQVAAEGRTVLPLDDPSVVFHHTYGYSIGLGFPPDWSDNIPLRMRAGTTTVLEPGMVFHVTMGLRRSAQYGAVTSETVAITDRGCEALTDFPRQYFYK